MSIFENQFRLANDADGIYSRMIDKSWDNGAGRIFGGYTAALSLAAAAAISPHPELCSFHILFLEPVSSGLITFEVNALRIGRAVAAVQVAGQQNDRKVLSSQVWLRPAMITAAAADATIDLQHHDPERAVRLPWFTEIYEFHNWMDTRVVDYAWSLEESLTDGDNRSVDLWSRPRTGEISPGFYSQLYDVILADGHIGSSQTRSSSTDPRRILSLDLSMQWAPALPRTGWRRMRAYSPPEAAGFAACAATIFDRSGALCATASQQTWTAPLR